MSITTDLRALGAACAAVTLAGCATMTQGTRQDVLVITPGVEGALCRIVDAEGKQVATVAATGQVRLTKGRRTLTAQCEKPGYQPGSTPLEPAVAARSRVQVPVGYAVDGLSGALWSYPATVQVVLTPAAPD